MTITISKPGNKIVLRRPKRPLRFLVFSGGGAKCAAYPGAIEALEKLGVLKNIEAVGGSSGGSLVAVLVALGMKASKIREVINSIDYTTFKDFDSKRGVIENKGFCKGQVLHDTGQKIIKEHLLGVRQRGEARSERGLLDDVAALLTENIPEDITNYETWERLWNGVDNCRKRMIETGGNIEFEDIRLLREVYQTYGDDVNKNKVKDLLITGTNLDTLKLELFTSQSPEHNKMPVPTAQHISSCLPFLFQPVKYAGAKYGDGGLLANTPIDQIKSLNRRQSFEMVTDRHPQEVLSLFLEVAGTNRWSNFIDPTLERVKTTRRGKLELALAKRLTKIDVISSDAVIEQALVENYASNSIVLPTEFGTTDLDLTEDQKIKSQNNANKLVNQHFERGDESGAQYEDGYVQGHSVEYESVDELLFDVSESTLTELKADDTALDVCLMHMKSSDKLELIQKIDEAIVFRRQLIKKISTLRDNIVRFNSHVKMGMTIVNEIAHLDTIKQNFNDLIQFDDRVLTSEQQVMIINKAVDRCHHYYDMLLDNIDKLRSDHEDEVAPIIHDCPQLQRESTAGYRQKLDALTQQIQSFNQDFGTLIKSKQRGRLAYRINQLTDSLCAFGSEAINWLDVAKNDYIFQSIVESCGDDFQTLLTNIETATREKPEETKSATKNFPYAVYATGINPDTINYEDSQGLTFLMRAAADNQIETVRFALVKGARVDIKDVDGYSAFDYALAADNPEVALELKEAMIRHIFESSDDFLTLVDHVVDSKQLFEIYTLLQKTPSELMSRLEELSEPGSDKINQCLARLKSQVKTELEHLDQKINQIDTVELLNLSELNEVTSLELSEDELSRVKDLYRDFPKRSQVLSHLKQVIPTLEKKKIGLRDFLSGNLARKNLKGLLSYDSSYYLNLSNADLEGAILDTEILGCSLTGANCYNSKGVKFESLKDKLNPLPDLKAEVFRDCYVKLKLNVQGQIRTTGKRFLGKGHPTTSMKAQYFIFHVGGLLSSLQDSSLTPQQQSAIFRRLEEYVDKHKDLLITSRKVPRPAVRRKRQKIPKDDRLQRFKAELTKLKEAIQTPDLDVPPRPRGGTIGN